MYAEDHQAEFERKTREGEVIPGTVQTEYECNDCGHRWSRNWREA